MTCSASSLDKSRTSLIISSSECPERKMISTLSRCSGFNSVSSSICAIPKTPFIGVRSSWVMVARNSDLTLFACSASNLAFSRATSIFLRSSISIKKPLKETGWPVISLFTVTISRNQIESPLAFFIRYSKS